MCVAEEEEEDEGMVFIVSNLPKWDMVDLTTEAGRKRKMKKEKGRRKKEGGNENEKDQEGIMKGGWRILSAT